MYQYGNVAVQYQNHKRRKLQPKRKQQKRPEHRPAPQKSSGVGISTGEKVLYILTIFLVVAVLSALLTANASISQMNYEIQHLEREVALIEEQNANLQLEITALSSPDRIIDIATNELGMMMRDSTVRIMSR